MSGRPPVLARALVARFVPDDVLGDLDESWRRIGRSRGAVRARLWYWRQALSWLRNARALRRTTDAIPASDSISMNALFEDLRYALRSLRRAPVFSLTCIGVLALGLGASTTIFSLANWVLLRPVPGVADPDRLATVRLENPGEGAIFSFPHPLVERVREGVEGFASLAAYSDHEAHLAVAGRVAARPVDLQVVTADFFDTLGMVMARGRGFAPDEALGGAGDPHVAVISWRLWRDDFGGDSDVLGRELLVNGQPMVVIGVAARGFLGPSLQGTTDLWAPAAAHDVVMPSYPGAPFEGWEASPWMNLVGRLSGAVEIEALAAQLAATEEAAVAEMPALDRFDLVPRRGVGMMAAVQERLVRVGTLLSLAVGFLLLITCANFGNLLLAQARRRDLEITVRAALGAARGRLVRQQLCASTALALAGGLAGLAASAWASGLFRTARILSWVEIGEVQPDLRVALFSLLAALACGALFGVIPALSVTRHRADLMSASRHAGGAPRRLRAGLLVLQLGVSFALVAGAFLTARTIGNLRQVQLGFLPDAVAAFEIKPGMQGYEGETLAEFFPRLLERVAALPGVESVSASQVQPFGRMINSTRLLVEGVTERDDAVATGYNTVTPSFFATLGLRLLAGRGFEPADLEAGAPPVAIVSQVLADRLFPGDSPLGRTVAVVWEPEQAITIVGVVSDVRLQDAQEDFEPWFFAPMGVDRPVPWGAVQVRSGRPAEELIPELRAAVAEIDEALPLFGADSMRGLIERRFSQLALLSRINGLFAALALLLATAGLYAVLSTTVAERSHELGVRAALGANGSRLARMVLGNSLRVALGGVVLGILLAFGLGKALEGVLFEGLATDPLALLVGALVLTAVTLAASLVPARRASRLDPVRVLRHQ